VDVWDGSPKQLDLNFRRVAHVTFPLLMKASALIRLYGLQQTNFVVVDHKGLIRYRSSGLKDEADVAAIREAIEAALAALDAVSNTDATTGVTGQLDARPQRLSLEQNYPNPFNLSTTVGFALRDGGSAFLRIYDLTGHLVRRLGGSRFSPGSQTLKWDGRDGEGRNVASGVYLYRLEAGGQTATRKMLLVR
jgi:hypothetical protein